MKQDTLEHLAQQVANMTPGEIMKLSRLKHLQVSDLQDIGRHLNSTLGAKGSLAVSGREQRMVEGFAVDAVDTTGAGDMYAGGCLYGWTQGMDPEQAAALGNYAAAALIQAALQQDSLVVYFQQKHRARGRARGPAELHLHIGRIA